MKFQGSAITKPTACWGADVSTELYQLLLLFSIITSWLKTQVSFYIYEKPITVIPKKSKLVTLDLKPLSTSTPNSEGIKPEKASYENLTNTAVATNLITTFLALILTLNNFIFNLKYFLEIKGCAMRTICAPSYENLFMTSFEQKHMYLLIKGKSLTYFRYIDDIFLI